MEFQKTKLAGFAVAAVLSQAAVRADVNPAPPVDALANVPAETPTPVKIKRLPQSDAAATVAPSSEEFAATAHGISSGLNAAGVFSGAVTPLSTTLSPPVTISAGGSTPALSINETGTGKGLQSLVTSSSNGSSAIFGQTVGGGAGVAGYNFGTVGVAGKFILNNAKAAQSALAATTAGVGPALTATASNSNSSSPVIVASSTNGVGLEATVPNGIGVEGVSTTYIAVLGQSTSGYAVVGEATSGTGIYGGSSTGAGVYATSSSGNGLTGTSGSKAGVSGTTSSGLAGINADNLGGGRGIVTHSASGIGIYSSSDTNIGVWGQSTNSYGVVGEDTGSGIGVWGQSVTGYAGFFQGKVGASQYVTASDRNLKTNFKPIDGGSILERVTQLPITTWDFKTDTRSHHLGPMAQDFHAAFHLNGDDDKNINLTDIAGVSLAAIQELSKQVAELKRKDAEIADLKARLQSVTDALNARLTALENQRAPEPRTAALVPADGSLRH